MKPFDLESAQRGEPIRDTAGTKVHFLAVDPQTGNVWARVEGEQTPCLWTRMGKEIHLPLSQPLLPPRYLSMAPKQRTVWVNLYHGSAQEAYWYDTQEQADLHAMASNRIGGKAWPLEIEE